MPDNERLDKLIDFYSPNFQIEYNVEIAGLTAPVMASMRSRQQKQIFGFGLKTQGPEACEFVFFIEEQSFDLEAVSRLEKLLETAEREYATPGRDHAFSFISAVVLARDAEAAATAALKKFRQRKNYRADGWTMARVALFCENGESVCSKDGADLKRMLEKIIK